MRRFFVDTFYLIALSNTRDQWHQRVMAFSQALTAVRLYTVEEVLAEFLTFCGVPLATALRLLPSIDLPQRREHCMQAGGQIIHTARGF